MIARFLPWLVTLLVIGGIATCYFLIEPVRSFMNEAWQVLTSDDRDRIQNWVQQLGFWGPMILILAMPAQMFLLVLPSLLVMVVAVLAFGAWWGSLINVAGVVTASCVGYALGYALNEPTVAHLLGKSTERKLCAQIDRHGFWVVCIFRLNPILSNDAISFVAGLLGMGFWRYLAATLGGTIPLTVLISLFSNNLDSMKWGVTIISVLGLAAIGVRMGWEHREKRAEAEEP